MLCHGDINAKCTRYIRYDNRDLAMLVATRIYEQGKLSLNQAAQAAGMTKRTFIELSDSYNVSIFNFTSI